MQIWLDNKQLCYCNKNPCPKSGTRLTSEGCCWVIFLILSYWLPISYGKSCTKKQELEKRLYHSGNHKKSYDHFDTCFYERAIYISKAQAAALSISDEIRAMRPIQIFLWIGQKW